MKLTVLGSGSAGNGYVLQNEKEALIIECGVPFKDCEEALGYDLSKVQGCIVSHVHGDHFGYAKQYQPYMSIFASQGTINASNIASKYNLFALQAKKSYCMGNYTIMPFDVQHDAPEPFGYLIQHPDFGLMMFATDTYYLRYTFGGLNYIMIECNYDKVFLDRNVKNNIVPIKVRERILESHMSCEDCIKTLKANNLSSVRAVILIHLSGNNSNAALFKRRVEQATGKQVFVAKKGLEIQLF